MHTHIHHVAYTNRTKIRRLNKLRLYFVILLNNISRIKRFFFFVSYPLIRMLQSRETLDMYYFYVYVGIYIHRELCCLHFAHTSFRMSIWRRCLHFLELKPSSLRFMCFFFFSSLLLLFRHSVFSEESNARAVCSA